MRIKGWTCTRWPLVTFAGRVHSNFRIACLDIRSSCNISNAWAYISWDRSSKIDACTYCTEDDYTHYLFQWDRHTSDIFYIKVFLLDIELLEKRVNIILHSIASGRSGVFRLIANTTIYFIASLAANLRVQSLKDTSTVHFRTKLIIRILLIQRLSIKKYKSVVLMLF